MHARLVTNLQIERDDVDFNLQHLPEGCKAMFVVSTFGKKQYFAVASEEDALTWVNSLNQARQEAITRRMGHAKNMPYPSSWDYCDILGDSLVKSKQRIKKKLEQRSVDDTELFGMRNGLGGFVA